MSHWSEWPTHPTRFLLRIRFGVQATNDAQSVTVASLCSSGSSHTMWACRGASRGLSYFLRGGLGGVPCGQRADGEVLIQKWPVNAIAGRGKFGYGPLCASCVRQPPRTLRPRCDRGAVIEFNGEGTCVVQMLFARTGFGATLIVLSRLPSCPHRFCQCAR